jgi:hypothetical protein
VVAENLIEAYQLDPGEAAMLRAEAIEGAGRSYPFKRGGRGVRRAPRLTA